MIGGDTAEEGHLALLVGGQFLDPSSHDQRGLDTDLAQFADAVLGGLGLEFIRGLEIGDVRQVSEDRVGRIVCPELPDGFEERQALDISDRAADLDDHEVGLGRLGNLRDTAADLAGQVRDDLHRMPQVLALALLLDDGKVHLPAGDIVHAVQVLVEEALVVPQVEVGLRTILSHKDFAVLKRILHAGVDVEIRVHLENGHREALVEENASQRSGEDALAQRRHNATGNEDELAHAASAIDWDMGLRAASRALQVRKH